MRHAPLRLALLLLASWLAAFPAVAADPTFRAFASVMELPEGGKDENMIMLFGAEKIIVHVPHGFGAQVKVEKNSVVFTDTGGTTAITLKATLEWPGVMPEEERLRGKALAANPGGTLGELAACPTGYTPGKLVDSAREITPTLSLKIRHGFVACPEGTLEVICAANGANFDAAKETFNAMMSSLKVERVKPEETAGRQ
jgi:hypothetical protein